VARGVETALDGGEHGSGRVIVQGGPRATLLVDRDQLESALVELLDNALRFTPSDGTVSVSWWLVADGLVGIDVEDEGPGVSDELRDRILRPFFSSTTHGTGLGLNIVSRMCHLLGGRLEWSNRPVAGARFTMVLPVLPES